MVKVATKFDAPIKLFMPQLLNNGPTSHRCSILGLGDIVIPGIYIGFLIRFGRYQKLTKNEDYSYTRVALVSYTVGLLVCIGCLAFFKVGQPALLYISPALLITTLIVGANRKHLSDMKRGIDVEIELK